jgi:hypothetical protein
MPTQLMLVLGVVCWGLSKLLFVRIVDEVNRRRPIEQRVNPWFADLRASYVLRQHRNLFPQNRKRAAMRFLAIAGVALILLSIYLVLSLSVR